MSIAALSVATVFFMANPPEGATLKEAKCVVEAVHYEANGESIQGKVGVMFTLQTRKISPRFPNTYCGVLKHENQFNHRGVGLSLNDVYLSESDDVRSFEETLVLVSDFLEGRLTDPTQGADHFYNPDEVPRTPIWAANPITSVRIGGHRFVRLY